MLPASTVNLDPKQLSSSGKHRLQGCVMVLSICGAHWLTEIDCPPYVVLFHSGDLGERRGQVWGQKGSWKIMTAYAPEINEHLFFFFFAISDLC